MTRTLRFASLALVAALFAAPAAAQEKLGTFFTGDLGYVMTGGNSVSESFALGMKFTQSWTRSYVTLQGMANRQETEKVVAVTDGTDIDFVDVSDLAVEKYSASAIWGYRLTEKLTWDLSGSWAADEKARIDSFLAGRTGLTAIWASGDPLTFKTSAGVSWLREEPTFDPAATPAENEVLESPGAYLFLDYGHKVTENTTLAAALLGDWGFQSSDLAGESIQRVTFDASVMVSMTKALALKFSTRLLWNGSPKTVQLDVFGEDGSATGTKVPYELDELDTTVMASLVVNLEKVGAAMSGR